MRVSESSIVSSDHPANDLTEFLPQTPRYFEVWLNSLKPSPGLTDGIAATEFRFEGTLHIDCNASGVLRSQTGTLVVTETAKVHGDIFVATAIIDGEFRGNIRATERVELNSHARVTGNIETQSLSTQAGAVFDGRCHSLAPNDESWIDNRSHSRSTNSNSSDCLPKPRFEEKPKAMAAVAL